jgi:tRNA-splicing ligase RtcB (3'-phosphate/5'-hydroxy nucleic acid ligase)
MLEYKGKYNSVQVMIDSIDETTVQQIYSFLNCPAFENSKIRIMPDCHAGAGAVIGTTMTMPDWVIPNVVGVDIGCGVLAIRLGMMDIDLVKLDEYIKNYIPAGYSHRPEPYVELSDFKSPRLLEKTASAIGEGMQKVLCQIGTLGGGNHFIEIDESPDGCKWLIVHTGSRNFGLRVAKYHQSIAKEQLQIKHPGASAYRELEYMSLSSPQGLAYVQDMVIAQEFASLNRQIIASDIMFSFLKMNAKDVVNTERIESIHNYINFEDNILRKGAVQANLGQKLIIPFNMRDGIAVCTGKGNPDWNNSAPHGAGRIMARGAAKRSLQLEDFTKSMVGIYTTTATQNTIDESPMVYKDKDIIIEAIKDTVNVDFLMKPIYNFKAGEE